MRDDWGNWFGCSNSRWIYHFPLPESYVRRNPYVPGPTPSLYLPADANAGKLKAISHVLERFNSPNAQGQVTSACGLGIYRDDLLGAEYAGNAFIGETAHNLVRRYRLDPNGATFKAQRPEGEVDLEFFASQDNWMRPVQIRTGPDGALYIVDMYRAVIEHTRWIPADRLAKINPRAGDTMGRIYRVVPVGKKLRPVRDLTKLDTAALVAALDTPNGTTRDLVHQLLLHREDKGAVELLVKQAASSQRAAVRVQSLAVLDGLRSLPQESLMHALADTDAHVRRHALRLCEKRAASAPELLEACLKLSKDPEYTVRYQLALSLGEWNDPKAASTLAEMAAATVNDSWFRAAVVSSSKQFSQSILDKLLTLPRSGGRDSLISPMIATAAAIAEKPAEFERLLDLLAPEPDTKPTAWQIMGMVQLQKALGQRKIKLTSLAGAEEMRPLFASAYIIAADEKAPLADRKNALQLTGRGFVDASKELPLLVSLLQSDQVAMQKAAVTALSRTPGKEAADAMLAAWPKHSPSLRTQIIGTLLARDAWILSLLQAVESGVIIPAEVSPASRQILARHSNVNIRQQSVKLFPVGNTGERNKVVEKYQIVSTLKGDAVKGATVFQTVCFTCHSYLGKGLAVGPDLKAFHDKSVSDFVTAILNPNAAVEPRYTGYTATTKDGRALTGVIANETATSIEVVMPGGLRENILRSDLSAIRAIRISLMPDGLEQALSPQAMADLIAFLKSGG